MNKFIVCGLIFLVFFVSLASLANNPNFSAIQNNNSQVHVNLTHEATTIYTVDAFNRTGAQYLNTEGNDTLTLTFNNTYTRQFGNGTDSYMGLAINASGFIYVVSAAGHIEIYDQYGNYVTAWGEPGVENYQFDNPVGIAIDANGSVYITDRDHYQLKKFTASGTFIYSKYIGGNMWDVEVDDTLERVYVGSNDNITVYDMNGTHLFKFGADWLTFAGGIAVNSTSFIYVADSAVYKTVIFNTTGGCVDSSDTNGVSTQFLTFNATDYVYQADHLPNRASILTQDCKTFLKNSTLFDTELQGIAFFNNIVYVAALDGLIRTFDQNLNEISDIYNTIGSYESINYTPYNAGNGTINSIHFACNIPSDSDLELHGFISLDNGSTWYMGMALPINDNDTSPLEFVGGFRFRFYLNFTASSDTFETPAFFWLEFNYTYTAQNAVPQLGDIAVSFDNETLEATISCLITDADNDTMDVFLCLPLGTVVDNQTTLANGTVVEFVLVCEYDTEYEYYFNVTDSEDSTQSSLFGWTTGAEPEEPAEETAFPLSYTIAVVFAGAAAIFLLAPRAKVEPVKAERHTRTKLLTLFRSFFLVLMGCNSPSSFNGFEGAKNNRNEMV